MVPANEGVVGEQACVSCQHLVVSFFLLGTIGEALSGCVSSRATSDEGRFWFCVNVLGKLQTCSECVTSRRFCVSSRAWWWTHPSVCPAKSCWSFLTSRRKEEPVGGGRASAQPGGTTKAPDAGSQGWVWKRLILCYSKLAACNSLSLSPSLSDCLSVFRFSTCLSYQTATSHLHQMWGNKWSINTTCPTFKSEKWHLFVV